MEILSWQTAYSTLGTTLLHMSNNQNWQGPSNCT